MDVIARCPNTIGPIVYIFPLALKIEYLNTQSNMSMSIISNMSTSPLSGEINVVDSVIADQDVSGSIKRTKGCYICYKHQNFLRHPRNPYL